MALYIGCTIYSIECVVVGLWYSLATSLPKAYRNTHACRTPYIQIHFTRDLYIKYLLTRTNLLCFESFVNSPFNCTAGKRMDASRILIRRHSHFQTKYWENVDSGPFIQNLITYIRKIWHDHNPKSVLQKFTSRCPTVKQARSWIPERKWFFFRHIILENSAKKGRFLLEKNAPSPISSNFKTQNLRTQITNY